MGHDDHDSDSYHPKDTIGDAAYAGVAVGVVGTIFSGIQASLTRRNLGAFGALTHYGGTTGVFGTFLPLSGAQLSFERCPRKQS
jgi:hypothetical protein